MPVRSGAAIGLGFDPAYARPQDARDTLPLDVRSRRVRSPDEPGAPSMLMCLDTTVEMQGRERELLGSLRR